MASHVLVVFSNPVPGEEAEYHRWYNEQHVPDVLANDGFVAAQRFELSVAPKQDFGYRYLCIYELETDDLDRARAVLSAAGDAGRVRYSAALDRPNMMSAYWTAICDRQREMSD